jgi:hypothetical protein
VPSRPPFVDLDGSPLDPVMRCNLEPHLVIESSSGRWHAYWMVDGLALAQFRGVQRAIIARFGGDPAIHDLPRVMRLPGFYHLKAKPFPIRIIHAAERLPYTADTILAEFPPTESCAGSRKATAPEEWQAIALQGVDHGARNCTIARIAGLLFRRLPDPTLAAELVACFNQVKCRPPLGAAELKDTLDSIAAKEMRRRGLQP